MTIQALEIDPGTPEWQKLLTASRWSVAAGVGPVSRRRLWREMNGLESRPKPAPDSAIAWGIENEAKAINAVNQVTGHYFLVNTATFINSKYPGLGATPDAFNIDATIGLEVKCPFFSISPADHVRTAHMCQVQACMGITERSTWYYASYVPGLLNIWRIGFSQEYFDTLRMWLDEFLAFKKQPPIIRVAPRIELLEGIHVDVTPVTSR